MEVWLEKILKAMEADADAKLILESETESPSPDSMAGLILQNYQYLGEGYFGRTKPNQRITVLASDYTSRFRDTKQRRGESRGNQIAGFIFLILAVVTAIILI